MPLADPGPTDRQDAAGFEGWPHPSGPECQARGADPGLDARSWRDSRRGRPSRAGSSGRRIGRIARAGADRSTCHAAAAPSKLRVTVREAFSRSIGTRRCVDLERRAVRQNPIASRAGIMRVAPRPPSRPTRGRRDPRPGARRWARTASRSPSLRASSAPEAVLVEDEDGRGRDRPHLGTKRLPHQRGQSGRTSRRARAAMSGPRSPARPRRRR